ncbi:MAG: 2,3-bisphosphoglycerate-independent phosphoglycerate mutase [Thiohalocapsa sp.]|uniref:2,3-bisphosphoglycerate-independent phosphoglycerate mutase n=1 Tax=Thiohalocapsa sp. TaxID=2497641 RepID=UPI0025E0F48A|nr:2,3-bisphosphoglycerate-independent phosphoglycerate mutase [Thiohalocapsa sp.]MCG6941111.1 2,3-bisphosphoglycerate-independent phosphoglycerate mutase [Thiohalocapsa sp.]
MTMQLGPWHESYHPPAGPVVLVIMDGIGLAPPNDGNAVSSADIPTLRRLWREHASLQLAAHGTAVGLPTDKDMGNSEVGHTIMGAGRVLPQGASLVQRAIADGSLFTGETWQQLVARCTGADAGTLHLIGLLSDGNVHSHIDHLFALLREADATGIARVRVHPLLDGRDVEPHSALRYLDKLNTLLAEISTKSDRDYRIASGGGRMRTTMDRYWERPDVVQAGWKAHVLGEARHVGSAREAVEASYADGVSSDQDIPAFVVVDGDDEPVGTIEDGDAVLLFNFRGDRAIELSSAFEYDDFDFFERGRRPDVLFVGMLQYDGDMKLPKHCLLVPPAIENTVIELLSAAGVPTFHVAESSKFGHVTYYLFGMRTKPFSHATVKEVSSGGLDPAEHPEMQAAAVADAVVDAIRSGDHRLIVVNFANGDMVGHTGNLEAAVKAVEAVDAAVTRIDQAVDACDGVLVITADHGNAEEMLQWSSKTSAFKRDAEGRLIAKTSHTLNLVPFVISDGRHPRGYAVRRDLARPGLGNIAATVLNLLGYAAPEGYEPSLIRPGAEADAAAGGN